MVKSSELNLQAVKIHEKSIVSSMYNVTQRVDGMLFLEGDVISFFV